MPLDTLEEIRLLSIWKRPPQAVANRPVRSTGTERSSQPAANAQLKERITHGFKVPPLDQKDIPEYLMFRMRAAGYHGPNIFSAAAIKLITSASQGITRRINVLADKALLAAFSENTHNILPKHVKAAVDDSEFAPPASAGILKKNRHRRRADRRRHCARHRLAASGRQPTPQSENTATAPHYSKL